LDGERSTKSTKESIFSLGLARFEGDFDGGFVR
jgi:hypothetical protein